MKKLFFIVLLVLGINCIYAGDYEWGKPITDYYPLHELKKSENIKSLQYAGQIYDVLEKQETILDLQKPVYEIYQNGRLSGFYFSLSKEEAKNFISTGVMVLHMLLPCPDEIKNQDDIFLKKLNFWELIKETKSVLFEAAGTYDNIPNDTTDLILKLFVYSENTIFTTVENYLDGEILYIYQPYNISDLPNN